ncbi:MAG: PIG-L family deacetylase, partial [bacterium]|nr:PIG-L family deacetylase [bacterium]
MDFTNPGAQIYVPDGTDAAAALQRTTHLAIGAHQDDIPIMAYDGILQCFGHDDKWFTGITVTDGAGSPRSDLYGNYTDAQMRKVRIVEEKKAAFVGDYSAALLLDYSSAVAKNANEDQIVHELANLIDQARPSVVYTHNLADKHDTHVAVTLRTLAAIRRRPDNTRPAAVFGCEVWRDLDWMTDNDK